MAPQRPQRLLKTPFGASVAMAGLSMAHVGMEARALRGGGDFTRVMPNEAILHNAAQPWGVATALVPSEAKMSIRRIVGLLAAAIIITSAVCADALAAPGACPNDSKLLNGGPTRISGEGAGTWWGLVMNGLVSAGFLTEAEQIDYLNEIFDTDLDTLEDLKAYNLQLVSDVWDGNHNGYVCAFQLRGTRAYFHNPYLDLTFFGVTDDRVAKK